MSIFNRDKHITVITSDTTAGIEARDKIVKGLDGIRLNVKALDYKCYGNMITVTASEISDTKTFIKFVDPSVLFNLNPDVIVIYGSGYSAGAMKELFTFVERHKKKGAEVYFSDIECYVDEFR